VEGRIAQSKELCIAVPPAAKTQLDGPELGELSVALLAAFKRPQLQSLLLYRLNRNWEEEVSEGATYQTGVRDIITNANMQGWIVRLIEAARAENPGNPQLYDFAQRLRLVSVGHLELAQALERVVKKTNRFVDSASWRTKLGEIEPRVCRIEITTNEETMVFGTGFLLGTRTLITNYHVMECVVNGDAKPANVVCRFDYKRNSTNKIEVGKTYGLATSWQIDLSPNTPFDEPAPEDRLDYALIRLDGTPGQDSIMPMPQSTGVPRGWLVPLASYAFPKDSPLFILQHPQGDPLKLALNTDSVIEVENNTRVRYRTNTEEGSSGSPCFNQDWELVALHHSGDPNFERPATYNEGIPFEAILKRLAAKGAAGEIGT
jgi:hypothetical protein